MKLDITKKETVNKMVNSLFYQAEKHDVSLKGINTDNWQWFLDDLFNDGGEIRCENFIDLSIGYSLQFGEFESIPMMNKHWECCIVAIKIIEKKVQ